MTISIGPFETNRSAASYPVGSGTTLIFGADYGHSGFVTPMARFQFFDPLGTTARGPIVFIRMGGSFQSALSNGFQETQSIFGQPNSDGTVSGALGAAAKGGLDALYKQVAGAAGSAAGFLGSAGLSGKAQYEFMTRRVLNTFQQLVYQGPIFRRFSLPFTMKPTSMAEAEIMVNIIKSFRIASSPKGSGDDIAIKVKDANNSVTSKADTPIDPNAPAAEPETGFTQTEINDLFGGGNNGGVSLDQGSRVSVSNFSFGYPDMCRFEIVLQKSPGGADTFLTQVFSSEYCVIENVQIDYGGQNKMVFLTPEGVGTATNPGKYYPSEVTLTINLKETSLPTDGAVFTDHDNSTRTIF